jgi:ubiquinone/menaquinone biosynthesis C-methylase UbiE
MDDHTRNVWAAGDYTWIGELLRPMARDLVSRAGVAPGERVLDVATGTGNAAIDAAAAGAAVTGCDLTPGLLDVARARDGGITWVEADAERLPFPDSAFDVVLSCIGAMFAPDQERTAAELTRVLRPGGRLALANWTPEGYGGRFLRLVGGFGPPHPGPSPLTWGEPAQVRRLLAGRVRDLSCEPAGVGLAWSGTPEELFELYRDTFGPVVTTRAALDDTGRSDLDTALLAFLRAEVTEQHTYVADYLSVTASVP